MSYPAFLKRVFDCDEGALRALSSQSNTRFCVDRGYIDAPTILRKTPASRTVYSRGDPCGSPWLRVVFFVWLYGYLSLVDECAAACDVGLPPCVYGEPADSHSVRDDETRTKYHLVELCG